MKIYDCFMFYNELDLLEIRLNELNDVVDYFVLVEGEKTHQNKQKEMLFQKNADRYKNFMSKIIHVVVPAEKYKNDDSMYNDRMQRKHICIGLESAEDDDNIIISDLDEIPSAESVKIAIKENKFPILFNQILHYYFLNTQAQENGSVINQGSCMLKKKMFFENTQVTRERRMPFYSINNGGWHFSFLGNENHVLNKLQNYAHDDWNKESFDNVKKRFESLVDPLNRSTMKLNKVDDLSYLPEYVKNNLEKFKKYIRQ